MVRWLKAAVGAVVLAGGWLAGDAIAQAAKPEVVIDVTVMKEVVVRDEQGNEVTQLREVRSAQPGDTLLYRITYTNRGDAAAHDPRIQDAIPEGTEIVPYGWSTGDGTLAVSVDGGSTFTAFPARRGVKLPDGSTKQQEVELASYTHVRWTSNEPLPPGESREVSFRVLVR
jgi:uncharacterized repeat protein (TIGR01451 family)